MKLFLIFPILLIILFLVFCIRVVKRHWIDKKGYKGGTEVAAKSVYEKFLNKQQKQGMQHIQIMKDAKLEDEDGDKPQEDI